jgi:formylglycine-generating enzyme required for sulfatase activity
MQTEPWQGKEFVLPSDDSPASYVSWNDAIAFCQKLTELERTAGTLQPTEYYRLPTEAEWEYACRAGTKTRFSFDDQASQLGEYAWFGGSSTTGNTKQEPYPHAVGTKLPNPWGLYDMHGNIREWCADIYKNKFSAKRETTTVNDDAMRVLRGGAWSDEATLCRAAARDWSSPTAAGRSFGFRVVREAAVPTKE